MAFPGFDLFFGSLELVKAHQRNFCVDTGLHHFDIKKEKQRVSELIKAQLRDCVFRKAQLRDSELTKAQQRVSELTKAQQRVSELIKAQLRDCEFTKAQQRVSELVKAQQRVFILGKRYMLRELDKEQQLLSELEKAQQRYFELGTAQERVFEAEEKKRLFFEAEEKKRLLFGINEAIQNLLAADLAKRQKHRLFRLLKVILLLLAITSFLPGLSSTTSCKKILHRKYRYEKAAFLIVWRCGDVEQNPGPTDATQYECNNSRNFCKKMISLLLHNLLSSKSEKCAHIYTHKPAGYPNNAWFGDPSKCTNDKRNAMLKNLYFLCVEAKACIPHECSTLIQEYLSIHTKSVSESDREQCTERCKEQCRQQCTKQCREQYREQCMKKIKEYLKRQKRNEVLQQAVRILREDQDAIKPFALDLAANPEIISNINRVFESLVKAKESVRGEKSDPSTQPTETTFCSRGQEVHTVISVSSETSERKDETDSPMNQSNATSTTDLFYNTSPTDLGSSKTKLPVGQRKRKRSAEAETEHSPADCQLYLDTTNGLELPVSYQASVPPIAVYQENHSAWDNSSISVAFPTQMTPAGTGMESNALSSNQNEVLPVIDPEYDGIINEALEGLPESPSGYVGWNSEVFNAITPEDVHNLSNIPSLRTHHLELPTAIKCIDMGTQTDGVPKEDKANEMEWV